MKTKTWLWLGLVGFLTGGFLIFTSEVLEARAGQNELIGRIDLACLELLKWIRIPALNSVAIDITAIGSVTIMTLLTVFTSCAFIFARKKRMAAQLIITALGSGFLSLLLKSHIERSRPDAIYRLIEVQGSSYPSGHTLSGAAIFFTLAILVAEIFSHKSQQILSFLGFSLLILAIGASRIYLGVHFFSDVVAGILLGIAWAALVNFIFLTREPHALE